jgi:hypothetical protein
MFNFRRMNMLGGIFKALVNPASLVQLAMGPAGWAQIAMKAVMQAVVQQVIQKVGQELGFPQPIIDGAKNLAGQQMGGTGDLRAYGNTESAIATNILSQASPSAQGQIQRDADGFGAALTNVSNRLISANDALDVATLNYNNGLANNVSDRELRVLEEAKDQAQLNVQNIDKLLTDLNISSDRKKMEGQLKDVMKGKGSLLMKLAILLGTIADQKMQDMATKADQIGKFGEVKGKNQGQYTKLTSEMQALGQEMNIVSQAASNVIKSIGEAASTLARKG